MKKYLRECGFQIPTSIPIVKRGNPMLVKPGTFVHFGSGFKAIVNKLGDVITVIPQ